MTTVKKRINSRLVAKSGYNKSMNIFKATRKRKPQQMERELMATGLSWL